MAGVHRSGARWIALLLGVALVAAGVVVYALIQVTTPADGGPTVLGTPSSSSAPTPEPSTGSVVAAATDAGAPSSSAPAAPSSSELGPAPSSQPPDQTASTPETSPPTDEPSSAGSDSSSTGAGAPTTATSVLAGSGIALPAAWSGSATITVTVLGQCATGSSSVYTAKPADLAMDLTQNQTNAVAPSVAAPLPVDEPVLTLGVNAAAVPSLAVYTSTVDETGAFHRYWQLQITPGQGRTEIQGTLLTTSATGANPNIMVDSETAREPCDSAGTVGLPRVLAPGSTITGWVSPTSAHLMLNAVTTDGKRAVMVEISATRKQ